MSSLERIQNEQGNDRKSGEPNGKERLNDLGFWPEEWKTSKRESLIRVLKYIKSSGKSEDNCISYNPAVILPIRLTGSNCNILDNWVDTWNTL